MIQYSCSRLSLQNLFDAAIAGLRDNCRPVHGSDRPVLIEGGPYPGIWLECAPLEGLVYAPISVEIARLNHTAFFREQFADGQIPPYIWFKEVGGGQIQQAVALAETAYELAVMTDDESLLKETYDCWSRWDAWQTRYRDGQSRHICEAFCEYDTGHDNSSRFRGIAKSCPHGDAKICPGQPGLPRVAPDLTATMFAGRAAMARIAELLGDKRGSIDWRNRAELTRQALLQFCYDPETEFFYDRDAQGNLLRIAGDAGLRVLMEHVPDQALFDRIFTRWIINPNAFRTPIPLPSIAANDAEFLYPPTPNCWGGPCQALLALRAPRWLEYYGKYAALDHLMRQYLHAFEKDRGFHQQLDPFTGEFSPGADGYSPAMCCVVDFITRREGVSQTPAELGWGCAALPSGETSTFEVDLFQRRGRAVIRHQGGDSHLTLNGHEIAAASGNVRLFSDWNGKLSRAVALAGGEVVIRQPGREEYTVFLHSDEAVTIP